MDKNIEVISISGVKRKKAKEYLIDEKSKKLFGFVIIGKIESALGYSYGNEVSFICSIYARTEFEKLEEYPEDREGYNALMQKFKYLYFERISSKLKDSFQRIEEKYHEDLEGIFVGGPNSLKQEFVKNCFLDNLYEDDIIDYIDLENEGIQGFRDLIEKLKFRIFKNGLYSYKTEKSFSLF
ncbi:MAG: hypothetical protein ACFE9S_17735 [Candidatus Hermodarchaeota archaeon]